MAMKNPSDVARKWQRNLSGAQESIKSGVQAVTVAPTEKAARAADRYASGAQRAVNEGRFQSGCRRVNLQSWQDSTITKGLPRIATGATAAIPKMESFMAEFLPHVEAGKRQLESMPRGDINQNLARMNAMALHNAEFKRRAQ